MFPGYYGVARSGRLLDGAVPRVASIRMSGDSLWSSNGFLFSLGAGNRCILGKQRVKAEIRAVAALRSPVELNGCFAANSVLYVGPLNDPRAGPSRTGPPRTGPKSTRDPDYYPSFIHVP